MNTAPNNTDALTDRLRGFDALLQASDLKPTEQVSVCILLVILSLRRAFVQLGIAGIGDGKKRALLRKAIERDFARKLLKYTLPVLEGEKAPEPVVEEPGGVT